MSKQSSEGDVIRLTNPSDKITRNDLPTVVAGYAGYWQENGVKPGKRGAFVVRSVVRDTITATGAIAEGDTIYINGAVQYGAFPVAANSAGAKPFAKALHKVAAGETREIEMRLLNG